MVDSCETRSTTTRKARLWMVSSRLSATRESGFSASCRTCISLRMVSRTSCAPHRLFEIEWNLLLTSSPMSRYQPIRHPNARPRSNPYTGPYLPAILDCRCCINLRLCVVFKFLYGEGGLSD